MDSQDSLPAESLLKFAPWNFILKKNCMVVNGETFLTVPWTTHMMFANLKDILNCQKSHRSWFHTLFTRTTEQVCEKFLDPATGIDQKHSFSSNQLINYAKLSMPHLKFHHPWRVQLPGY